MLRPGKIWRQSYTQVLRVSNALNVWYWDRYSDIRTQFAIAADKRGLALLYIQCKLVSTQPHSYFLQIFIKSILEIFYVRVVAEQNSININSIKRYATEIDNSKLYVIYKNKKK